MEANMHCPDCGTKASAGQKFCRACGFGLEKVERLIVDENAAAADQTTGATGGLSDERSRKLEKWIARALIALGAFFGGLILWAIIVKGMIEQGQMFAGSLGLLALAVAALAIFWAFLREMRGKSASTQSKEQKSLPQAPDTAKMLSEPDAEMTHSVTEHTTARLGERVGASIEKRQLD